MTETLSISFQYGVHLRQTCHRELWLTYLLVSKSPRPQ